MAAEGDRPAAEPPAEATGRDASAQDRPAPASGVGAEVDAPAPPSGPRPGWSPGERGAAARPGSGGQGSAPAQSGRGGPRRGGPSSDRPSGPPDRGPRDGRDDRRRRRDGREGQDRRPFAGFGDAIERSVCLAFQHAVPPAFPVQHRHGVATLRVTIVARRPEAILLCDGGHPGPHRWPDGEPVGSDFAGSEGAAQGELVAEPAGDRDEHPDQRSPLPGNEES